MINTPSYHWFVQFLGGEYVANLFSGSLGTNPQTGYFSSLTFNYKMFVEVEKDKGPTAFCAEYYIRPPFFDNSPIKGPFSKKFEASPDGLKQAVGWLCEEYLKGK